MSSQYVSLIALVVVVFAVAFCGAAQVNITLSGNAYSPSSVNVAPGDTVVWKWLDGNHDVTQSTGSTCTAAATPAFGPSQTTSTAGNTFTFNVPTNAAVGTVFNFFCSVHCSSGMKGTLTVAAASTTTQAQTTTQAPTSSAASVTVQLLLAVVALSALLM